MSLNVYPEWGHEADVASVENSYGGEMINLIDGISEKPFVLRTSKTITKERKLCAAIGISKSTSPSANKIDNIAMSGVIIDSATYTKEEIVAGPIYMPTTDYQGAGGAEADPAEQLIYAACMKWPRTHYTIALRGKGRLPVRLLTSLKVGMAIPATTGIIIQSGTDVTTLIDTTTANGDVVDMTVMPPVVGTENEETWQAWSLDFEGWKTNDTIGTSPLLTELTLFGVVAGEEISSAFAWYKITTTLTLSEDAHAVLREVVECYVPGTANTPSEDSTIPVISYPA